MFRRLMVSEQQRKRMLNVANVSCCLYGMDVEKTARVIHHCHLSGALFGVAYSKCNLRARTTNFLPVFFHNLSRYDPHHILKRLKLKVSEELSATAKTDETYISFSISIPVGTYKKQSGQLVNLHQSLRFLDSYQFVSESLENLAKTLKKVDFFLLKQFFHNVPDQIFLKLTQKGFFLKVTSTVLKSSKSLFQIMVMLGKIVFLVKSILLILTINIQSVVTMILVAKTWETITTCI